VIENLPADVGHSSGITLGGGYIWVSSTYPVEAAGDDGSPKLVKCNPDGSTASRYDTPGSKLNVLAGKITGAHGMEWVDDENMWVAVPPLANRLPDGPRNHDRETFHTVPRRPPPRSVYQRRVYVAG